MPNPSTASLTRREQTGLPPPASRDWRGLSDSAVLEACAAGSEDAWCELVVRYSRLVYSVPRRYGLDVEASEDVFQEVFAILVRQLPRIRRRSGLPKWFITTTHRVCRQWVKHSQRVSERRADPGEALEPPPDLVQRWERQHMVRQALRRLGGRCEELLVALYGNRGTGSYERIARQLDMAVGSVGPTRARCFQKLMELLERMEREAGR